MNTLDIERVAGPWWTVQLIPRRQDMSPTFRWSFLGAVLLGATGAAVGLVLGLYSHPATAAFATPELGAPAGVLGALLGVTASKMAQAMRYMAGSIHGRQTHRGRSL